MHRGCIFAAIESAKQQCPEDRQDWQLLPGQQTMIVLTGRAVPKPKKTLDNCGGKLLIMHARRPRREKLGGHLLERNDACYAETIYTLVRCSKEISNLKVREGRWFLLRVS